MPFSAGRSLRDEIPRLARFASSSRAPRDRFAILVQDSVGDLLGAVMLPTSDHQPSVGRQLLVDSPIPLLVCGELWSPVRDVRSRRRAMKWASVPEASINEDCDPRAREDYVGMDEKPAHSDARVFAKPQTSPVKFRAYGHFRLRIDASVAAAHFRCSLRRWRGIGRTDPPAQADASLSTTRLLQLPTTVPVNHLDNTQRAVSIMSLSTLGLCRAVG